MHNQPQPTIPEKILPHDGNTHCSISDIEEGKSDSPPEVAKTPDEHNKEQKIFFRNQGIVSTSIVFSCRVVAATALSSLFVLLSSPNDPYPQGVWVYTTAIVTTWLPQLDTATAIAKVYHRILGTTMGAILALGVGVSVLPLVDEPQQQAAVLGAGLLVGTAVYSYVSEKQGFAGKYSALLFQLTFGIVALSFLDRSEEGPVWEAGVFRVINILIGCSISAIVTLVVFPRSTKNLILQRFNSQMKSAGVSAKMVLDNTYNLFSKGIAPPTFRDVFRKHEPVADEAHEAYVEGLATWQSSEVLFSLLTYDPFHRLESRHDRREWKEILSAALARAFLIETTVVTMDTISRNQIVYDNIVDSLCVLLRVGKHVNCILDLSNSLADREQAVAALMEQDLMIIRSHVSTLKCRLSQNEQQEYNIEAMQKSWTTFDDSLPLSSLDPTEQTFRFFLLVEQLIWRSIRQHSFCVAHGIGVAH